MVLPQMRHFMGEGGQHFADRAVVKMARIERDLVRHKPVAAAEAVAGEIPVGAVAALQRDQAVGQFAFEQRPVQIVVRLLESGRRFLWWV